MDWIKFISEMTGHLSWPLTVVIVICLLRSNIKEILPRIEKFKHKDTELEFTKVVDSVLEKAVDAKDIGFKLAPDLKAERERLYQVIDIAPLKVIHQSYSILDRELLDLYNHSLKGKARTPILKKGGAELRESLDFDYEFEQNYKGITRLRRFVMDNRKHNLSNEEIHSYVDLVLDLTEQVRQKNTDKLSKQ
jgi:hypothetical protein